MRATIDAVFRGGVFRPVGRPDLPEGEHVRITIESAERPAGEDVLRLAAHVYQGLSAKDIDEIEEMARHRALFSNAHL